VMFSPVPVGGVVGDASLVDAALGQGFLLVQDELLETHLHLGAGNRTWRRRRRDAATFSLTRDHNTIGRDGYRTSKPFKAPTEILRYNQASENAPVIRFQCPIPQKVNVTRVSEPLITQHADTREVA